MFDALGFAHASKNIFVPKLSVIISSSVCTFNFCLEQALTGFFRAG
jgi:hypothetical protein